MEKISHDVQLLTLGKGILKFDRFDVDGLPTGLRDLGNAPTFNLSISLDKLEHLSSREGIATQDMEVTRSRKFQGSFELEEMDRENLRLWLMAETGSFGVRPMTAGEIRGTLDFVATNDQGPRYHYQGWDVKLFPKGDLGLISTDWGKFGFDFTVQKDEGDHPESPWGELTLLDES
jgi:hypothetical protein